MTEQEKQLLLKDLCARLPYGVFMTNKKLHKTFYPLTCEDLSDALFDGDWDDIPYLRPMSSMTEEEHNIVNDLLNGFNPKNELWMLTDLLDKRMLDQRGLIEKGLALEAPKGMYN